MSSEIIEAVFKYSEVNNIPLMLIASKNQIDWDGGYVNTWTTRQYASYISDLKKQYSQAKVYICRDHCGPGFKSNDLNDVYKTIDDDIENNFDLIHVDFCHFDGDKKSFLESSTEAIRYILKKSPQTLIEVGTDENVGARLTDVSRIEEEMKFFTAITPIHFFVCQTGSLTQEINQTGDFNLSFLVKVREVASRHHLFLKEHNGDYLDAEAIKKRKGLIDAINIAPQYGLLQTYLTLEKSALYGIDAGEFLEDAYLSNRWRKWLFKNDKDNRFLCSLIAGHYVFSGDAYRRLYEKISRHENFKETVINEMMRNFDIYAKNL